MPRAVAGDLYSVWKGVARHETSIQNVSANDKMKENAEEKM